MALVQYKNEYGRLKKVALYRPRIRDIEQNDPEAAMYVSLPNPLHVLHEFQEIVDKLENMGIEVVVLEPPTDLAPMPNMIFLRDVAFVFRNKIVLANMKHTIRKEEPTRFKELLSDHDPAYGDSLINLDAGATMEGADIFVINDNLLYVYTGNRTNIQTVEVLRREFSDVQVKTIEANIHGVPQHILGGVHILDHETATRRVQYCTDAIENYRFVDFEENKETGKGFALNIVTISPKEILMPAGNRATKSKLESNGVTCHEVEIQEIHKMGGGLACMILPLWRD